MNESNILVKIKIEFKKNRKSNPNSMQLIKKQTKSIRVLVYKIELFEFK